MHVSGGFQKSNLTRIILCKRIKKYSKKCYSKLFFKSLVPSGHYELSVLVKMGSEESLLKKEYDTPLNIMTVIHLRCSLVKFVFDRYEADYPPTKKTSLTFLQRSLLGDWCCPSDKQVWAVFVIICLHY